MSVLQGEDQFDRAGVPAGESADESAVGAWIPWAAIGVAGAAIRLLGLDPAEMAGALTIVTVGIVWAVVLRWLAVSAPGSAARIATLLVLAVVSVVATGPLLGRDSLLVGIGGVVVLDAALRRRRMALPWYRTGRGVAPLAVAVLLFAEWRWVGSQSLLRHLVLLLVAYLLALVPDPRVPSGVAESLGRSADSRAGAIRSVVSRPATRVWVGISLLGAGVAAAWSPAIWRLVRDGDATRVLGINDYPLHVEVGGNFSLIPYVNNAPHFLFHAMTAAWHLVFSLEVAAVLAICTAVTLSFVAVVTLVNQRPRVAPRVPLAVSVAVAAWFFLAESPGLFALWSGVVPETSPLYTLHWWGNPTWLAAMPFLVVTLPLIEEAIETTEQRRPQRWPVVLLSVVTVLGAVAKPALAIPLVPALPIYLVAVRRAPWRVVRRLLSWCVVPAGLVVFWQTWFLDSSDASEFSSGFTVEFVVDAPFGWANVGWVFLFPFLLIVLAASLSGRDYLRDRSVQLLMVCLAFAVPLMLLVNETGERSVHGNFAVPAQGCMTLLVLVSVRIAASRLLVAWHTRDEIRSLAVIAVVGVVGAAFLAGGVLSLLDGIGAASVPIEWLDNI